MALYNYLHIRKHVISIDLCIVFPAFSVNVHNLMVSYSRTMNHFASHLSTTYRPFVFVFFYWHLLQDVFAFKPEQDIPRKL